MNTQLRRTPRIRSLRLDHLTSGRNKGVRLFENDSAQWRTSCLGATVAVDADRSVVPTYALTIIERTGTRLTFLNVMGRIIYGIADAESRVGHANSALES